MAGSKRQPIGVFDSGIGGLTVLREMVALLPGEDTIYLGDTARVPYGTKSAETVARYALQNARFLLDHQVKLLVVACNTASAVGLPLLRRQVQQPVVGVIEPGARAAVACTRIGRIGVIGTEVTIQSGAYEKAIHALDPRVQVYPQACPLFVPLVEEDWTDLDLTYRVAQRYLEGLRGKGIDTLVLGCTHYPLLAPVIQQVMGEGVTLIDSAKATAREVKEVLAGQGAGQGGEQRQGLTEGGSEPLRQFFVSDLPERFMRVGERFLEGCGVRLINVAQVDIAAF